MTNREVLIQALQNFKGEYEENVTDYIQCPYTKGSDCKNDVHDRSVKICSPEWFDNCKICKQEWLEKEWEE